MKGKLTMLIVGLVLGGTTTGLAATRGQAMKTWRPGSGILCIYDEGTVACGMTWGGYKIGVNSQVVQVNDAKNRRVFRRFQP